MPIAVIISIISVAFSVFFGLFTLGLNLKNNKKSDNAELTERVKENTRINMKLDTISSNTTEIKNEVTEMRKELNSHDNRIIKVEESVKSAHHRIDGLEARPNCLRFLLTRSRSHKPGHRKILPKHQSLAR